MLLALVASARAQLLGFVQSDEAQFLAAYAELTDDESRVDSAGSGE